MGARQTRLTAIDLCAGIGGQALGLEAAGFEVTTVLDIDADSCRTLTDNRPEWQVINEDLHQVVPTDHPTLDHADLLICGLPRSPYTAAGRQYATDDKRDTLRDALDMAGYVQPRAFVLENIPGFVNSGKFKVERDLVREELKRSGYETSWAVFDAQHFGVPQRREHGFMVAMRPQDMANFSWPEPPRPSCATLGETLRTSMASKGWPEADRWAELASEVAPTIVGGATNRGGADLGPSRSKAIWARLGVHGASLGDDVPGPDFRLDLEAEPRDGLPRLTVDQVCLLQGFTPEWRIHGRKTSAYRQISQTVPPVVAEAVGRGIARALRGLPADTTTGTRLF